jgi:cyanophycinase
MSTTSTPRPEGRRGWLALLGGSGGTGPGQEILRRFVHLAGGSQARLLVVPTASGEPLITAEKWVNAFKMQDVQSIDVLDIRTRDQADSTECSRRLDDVTAVVITGGDQLRLLEIVGGTRFCSCLHDRWQDGLAVVGSSAGAMALGDPVIVRGEPEVFYLCDGVRTQPGLAVFEGITVDSHVVARGRMVRLLPVVAARPDVLGIGVDEDTAAFIGPDDALEVIGVGVVLVLDASKAGHRHVPRGRWDERLSIEGLHLHVLAAPQRFSLHTRQFLSAGQSAGQRLEEV